MPKEEATPQTSPGAEPDARNRNRCGRNRMHCGIPVRFVKPFFKKNEKM